MKRFNFKPTHNNDVRRILTMNSSDSVVTYLGFHSVRENSLKRCHCSRNCWCGTNYWFLSQWNILLHLLTAKWKWNAKVHAIGWNNKTMVLPAPHLSHRTISLLSLDEAPWQIQHTISPCSTCFLGSESHKTMVFNTHHKNVIDEQMPPSEGLSSHRIHTELSEQECFSALCHTWNLSHISFHVKFREVAKDTTFSDTTFNDTIFVTPHTELRN